MASENLDVHGLEQVLCSPGGCREVVLDAELVAIDRDKNELRSFQELSTRARGAVSSHEVSRLHSTL